MIRKVVLAEAPKKNMLVLPKSKKPVLQKRTMSLPARKELQTQVAEQPGRKTKVFTSTRCSDYEPIDYCSPLFP
ncbi:hypothetical protein J6S88_05160 [bacterium]|nr:hypothetical protein [bacterium]